MRHEILEHRDSVIRQCVEIDGGRVCYLERPGSGEPAIFLHEAFRTSSSWLHLMPYLDSGTHAIAPDLPGIGESSIFRGSLLNEDTTQEFLEEMLNGLGIDSAHFVGCSLGGSVALLFAYKTPDRVKSLTLVTAPYDTSFSDLWNPGWKLGRRILKKILSGERGRRTADLASWVGMSKRQSVVSSALTLYNFENFDCRNWARSIEVPTLIIGAKHDHQLLASWYQAWTEIMPQARLEWLDVGHHPQIYSPQSVARLIGEHIARPAYD